MNKQEYNNVIETTIAQQTGEKDSLQTTREVLNNMGVVLPQGNLQQVSEGLATDDYMGWRKCTVKEAQEYANEGTAVVAIGNEQIALVAANDDDGEGEVAVTSAAVMTLDENTPALAVADMVFYANRSLATFYPVDFLTGVQTFSLRNDGDRFLSKNFRVREFKCNDGSDEILIDMALVAYLQALRDWAGASITINSAYRTRSHNANVGGSSTSKHLEGKAADIVCSGKTPLQLAQKAETLGMLGIEWNVTQNYTHIDTRTTKWFTKYVNGSFIDVQSFYN